jgi:hypothetical protein
MTPKCISTLGVAHFGSYTCAGVVNVQNLAWKGKQAPNWAPKIPLKRS